LGIIRWDVDPGPGVQCGRLRDDMHQMELVTCSSSSSSSSRSGSS
jgi:hypothetical protein